MHRFTCQVYDRSGDRALRQWIARDEEQYETLRESLGNLRFEFSVEAMQVEPLYRVLASGDHNFEADFMTLAEVRMEIESRFDKPCHVPYMEMLADYSTNSGTKPLILDNGEDVCLEIERVKF